MDIDSLIQQYADGEISRTQLQEETGLSFFDVLDRLASLNLKLPKVDTFGRYNEKQKLIFNEFFGIVEEQ